MYFAVIVILFLLLLSGLPIAFVLGVLGLGTMIVALGPDLAFKQVPIIAYKSVASFTLLALPGFILTGELLLRGGVGERLYFAADRWLRHFPGGLAIATIVVCGFFAAIAGTSIATAMTIGVLASSQMIAKGYPPKMAFAVLAAAGTLGILIPPSNPMIIFGALTETSVLRMFAAGIIPGILLALLFIAYVVLASYKTLERQPPASWQERWMSLKDAGWAFLIPIVLFGGMYSGYFTPTEAAAVSALVTLIVGLIYKGLNRSNIMEALSEAAASSGMILFIVVGGLVLGHAITIIDLPTAMANFVASLYVPSWVMVLAIVGILAVLGMFLEVISILLITVPVFYPVMVALGIDPMWIGVMIVITLEMALITPPVGGNLFVMMGLAKKQNINLDVFTLGWHTLPYVICMILLIIIILIFPQLALWLPDVLYNK